MGPRCYTMGQVYSQEISDSDHENKLIDLLSIYLQEFISNKFIKVDKKNI